MPKRIATYVWKIGQSEFKLTIKSNQVYAWSDLNITYM